MEKIKAYIYESIDSFENVFEDSYNNFLQIISNYKINKPLLTDTVYTKFDTTNRKELELIIPKDYDIYCFLYYRNLDNQLIQALTLKKLNPAVKILFCGFRVSTNKFIRDLLSNIDIDWAIGDEDKSIYDYIYDYENFYKKDHFNPLSSMTIDDVPKYTQEELEYSKYSIQITASKGCANNCKFCDNCNYRFDWLPRKVLLEWIEYYNKIGIKKITFKDFNINRFEFDLLLNGLIAMNNKIKFVGMNFMEFNNLSLENSNKLLQAGFTSLFFGIECMSKETQLLCNKKMPSYEQVYNIIKNITNQKIDLALSTIFGFPNQSIDSFLEELEFILKLRKDFPKLSFGYNKFSLTFNSYMLNNIEKFNIKLKKVETKNLPEINNIELPYNIVDYVKFPNNEIIDKMAIIIKSLNFI